MLTLEQRNFISVLESKGVEGEHQIPYLRIKFNTTDNGARQLQNDYWYTIYDELKQPVKPMTATNKFDTINNLSKRGEQTINKTVTGFLYRLGQYENKRTGVTQYDSVTMIFKLTLLILLAVGLIAVALIMFGGVTFL